MQTTPDWTEYFTAAQIEFEFSEVSTGKKFEFKGPGFYLTDDETLLITYSPAVDVPAGLEWHPHATPETVYLVSVYGCRFEDTIFGCVALAPTRLDERRSALAGPPV